MSRPADTTFRAARRDAAAEALVARALLDEVRGEDAGPLPRHEAVFDAIHERVTHARLRANTVLAAFACAAAFLAGIWAASRFGLPNSGSELAAARPGSSSAASSSSSSSGDVGSRLLSPARLGDRTGAGAGLELSAADAQRWQAIDFDDLGLVELYGSGSYEVRELGSERQLRFGSGVLRAQVVRQDPFRPLVVVSPQLRVVVVGTRFDVYSDDRATRVEVIEGHVRVETEFGSVGVGAGESLRSDDPRLLPATPDPMVSELPAFESRHPRHQPPGARATTGPTPAGTGIGGARPSVADCGRIPAPDARRACFEMLASGDGLAAEYALVALGRLARDVEGNPQRAVDAWRAYEARFPLGTLAPEATLHLFETLLRLGRTEEASAAAARFEERFAEDPRTPRVSLSRARLLCGPLGEHTLGRTLIERLELSADAQVRAEAARLRADCEGPSFGPAGPGSLIPRDIFPGNLPGD